MNCGEHLASTLGASGLTSVPQALIAARYRATAAPKTTSSTAVGPSKRHSKNPPPALTQELVYRVQMHCQCYIRRLSSRPQG
ncbi:hypothetical protein AG1IA_10370 [Rhizoctonia solani AG-1 IA]|uniref:Uncharacterized protein n=1 Tax=Thanatephorus cucumeris (strain AG1-IA) TaxID=983506 RepID=L8WCA8_THACA|nr:hypothetical protein AG1IA_10370 [Rhizoctonia solani AG-1 IA]